MGHNEWEKKNRAFNDLLRRTASNRDIIEYKRHYALLCKMIHNCEATMIELGSLLVLDEDIKQMLATIKAKAEYDEPEIKCFRNFFVAGSEGNKDRCDSILSDFKKDCLMKLLSLDLHVIDIQIHQNLVRVKAFRDEMLLEFSCHGLPNTYSCIGSVYRDAMDCCLQAIGYVKYGNILSVLIEYYQRNDYQIIKLLRASEIAWDGEDNVIKGTIEKNDIQFTLKLRYDAKLTAYSDSCTPEMADNKKIDFDNMDGHDFEFFCAKLLEKNGFDCITVTQGSGDQGIDIIAYHDDVKYGIQYKCYSSPIGNHAVQEVFAGKTFYQCHVGVVLTNSYFTSSAIDLARCNGVILWDRDKLLRLVQNL